MPSYDKQFLDCDKTIDEYEKRQLKATGWNKYMLGRRASDFVYTYTLQVMNIHSVQLRVDRDSGEYEVCSCGLKNFSGNENHLVGGHLYNGKPTSQIIIWQGQEHGHVLYCQECRQTWFPVDRGEYQFYGLPDVDVAATLAQHPECANPTNKPLGTSRRRVKEQEGRFGTANEPMKLPLINQEPDEIEYREIFRTKAEEEFDGQ